MTDRVENAAEETKKPTFFESVDNWLDKNTILLASITHKLAALAIALGIGTTAIYETAKYFLHDRYEVQQSPINPNFVPLDDLKCPPIKKADARHDAESVEQHDVSER